MQRDAAFYDPPRIFETLWHGPKWIELDLASEMLGVTRGQIAETYIKGCVVRAKDDPSRGACLLRDDVWYLYTTLAEAAKTTTKPRVVTLWERGKVPRKAQKMEGEELFVYLSENMPAALNSRLEPPPWVVAYTGASNVFDYADVKNLGTRLSGLESLFATMFVHRESAQSEEPFDGPTCAMYAKLIAQEPLGRRARVKEMCVDTWQRVFTRMNASHIEALAAWSRANISTVAGWLHPQDATPPGMLYLRLRPLSHQFLATARSRRGVSLIGSKASRELERARIAVEAINHAVRQQVSIDLLLNAVRESSTIPCPATKTDQFLLRYFGAISVSK